MKLLGQILACAAAAHAAGVAIAQAYPAKPVRMIVGFPAGGPADIFGRSFAHALSAGLGQQVIVENKSGVGGVLGIDAVAKALPDGYTLGFNNQGSVAMAPFALSTMPFNPQKDLALITTVVKVPEVVVVNPSLPVNGLAELIAYARANPGKINFGSAGADLLGGQVNMGIFDIPVVLPHIQSGKFKALAVTSAKRAPSLPNVPTTAETGYPKVISDNWYGLVAPAATPPAVLKRVHEAAVAALRSPELLEQFSKVSGIAFPSTPQEYAAFLSEEQARWSTIIKAIGFRE